MTVCAVMMCFAACGSDGAVTASATGDAAEQSDPSATSVPATAETPTEVPAEEPDPEYDPEAIPLGDEGPVEPGSYRSDIVGVPVSMTVPEGWILVEHAPVGIALIRLPSAGPFEHDITITRPVGLSDPADPTAAHLQQDAWPITDIAGWLDNLGSDIEVTNGPNTTRLGGRRAVQFDLRLAPTVDCDSGGVETRGPAPCAYFFASGGGRDRILPENVDVRVWWVDGGIEPPIVVFLGAGETGVPFFEEAGPIVDSLAFGPPGPNPVSAEVLAPWTVGINGTAPAGEVTLPIAGGLVLNLPTDQEILWGGRGFARLTISGTGTEVDILQPRFASGRELESVDDVVEVFKTHGAYTIVEAEPTTIAGYPTRVLDLTEGSKTFELSVGSWTHPEEARIWLLDTPRGVLMFTAERIHDGEAIDGALDYALALMNDFTFTDETDG